MTLHASRFTNKSSRLRELIARQTVVMPGAFNALTAMQIEQAGFQALYVSGAALSAARGVPDVGLLSLTEMAADAGTIARSVAIPALADADTGYGPPLNVMRAVTEFERAGLAAIQLEDQDNPKKCGHLPGKQVVPASEMVSKVRAAVQARRDPSFMIVARTDARAVHGLEEAVRRGIAYVEAGADALFPEALESAEEFQTYAHEMTKAGVKVPLVANMTEFGKTPYLSVSEFESLGYRVILFPVSTLRAAAKAVEQLLAELKAHGTQQHWLGQMQTRRQLYDLLRYDEYERRERNLMEKHKPREVRGQ
ncbi:MAG: methylisocitrate lyase [Nitrospirae bacterium]|nr:methylisocitrate lyase [Nitrospirota bacterium]